MFALSTCAGFFVSFFFALPDFHKHPTCPFLSRFLSPLSTSSSSTSSTSTTDEPVQGRVAGTTERQGKKPIPTTIPYDELDTTACRPSHLLGFGGVGGKLVGIRGKTMNVLEIIGMADELAAYSASHETIDPWQVVDEECARKCNE
jgi:hypothetical protein